MDKKEKDTFVPKNDIPKFCIVCGKEILPDDFFIFNRTRRGTENYVHMKCSF